MENTNSLKYFKANIWPAVLEECRKNIATEAAYNIWISPLVPKQFDNGRVVLATHEFKRTIVMEKFFDVLNNAFESILGFSIDIEIIVQDDAEQEDDDEPDEIPSPDFYINTFETFIVSSSNRLAYAAATAVAKNPGSVHNPLFIVLRQRDKVW